VSARERCVLAYSGGLDTSVAIRWLQEELGYDVITLTDCTAATSAEEQKSATAQDYPMFSQPMTSDQVVGALKGTADVVKA